MKVAIIAIFVLHERGHGIEMDTEKNIETNTHSDRDIDTAIVIVTDIQKKWR
jgi:hypothetical protein